ncbi:DUF4258 domain-containing protein [Paenibacillus dendritiformis]|uniref:DUF4258 domain-containing protein n=1 Tax=Paenibacillus dendritiformis TaxID=130049 RepID=UPI00387E1F8E
MSRPQPLDQETLFKLVKALTRKGFYTLTTHAEKRMEERNFTRDEIEYILLHPSIVIGTPRYDNEYKTYKYRIQGEETERSIVITIDFDDLMLIITVI